MDIEKILTLSTAHIREETSLVLENELKNNALGLIIFKKGEYGWFIFVDDFQDDAIPDDLAQCMETAKNQGCKWLCLDIDGKTIKKLKLYVW